MPSSQWLKITDVQAITRLLGECRELGDDAVVWRQHFLGGVGKLLGAELILGGEVTGCLRGPLRWPGGCAWGFEYGFDLRGYQRLGESFAEDPFQSEMWTAEIAAVRASPEQGVTLPRQRLVSDRQWRRSFDFQQVASAMGTDEVMQGLYPIAGIDDAFEGIAVCRAPGRAAFAEREVLLCSLVCQEAARLVGGPLARFEEPAPSQLSPRLRQTLRCLLEGDSDKQIAARLSLSPHTVNQYTKQIYRHFQVNGRMELLARWVRRGWGANSRWEIVDEAPTISVAR